VIPTYNRADDLIATLDSLNKSEVKMSQVVVVDNGSVDDTVEKMEIHYPKVHLLKLESNIGATGGSNAGFDFVLAKGADYIIRMDSDIEVDPGFLTPLIKVANSDPKIGIISPKIYYYDNPNEIWYGGVDKSWLLLNVKDKARHTPDSPSNSEIREVDYAWGATMLIDANLLRETNGFDTQFFIYYEEMDFCNRAKSLGYKIIFVPKSKTWHKVGSIAYTPFTAYHWNRSRIIYIRKHALNTITKMFYIGVAFAYAFIDALFFVLKLQKKMGNRGPLKATLNGLWAGLNLPLTNPQEQE
jgi:hypothetical protein